LFLEGTPTPKTAWFRPGFRPGFFLDESRINPE
jgi:hypothetical protein